MDFFTKYSELINNKTPYTLSFWAKASVDNVVIVSYLYESSWNLWRAFGSLENMTSADGACYTALSTEWKHYTVHWYPNVEAVTGTDASKKLVKKIIGCRLQKMDSPYGNNNADIYLAGGCFWGTEHYFKQIEGVVNTEVGFANGHTENPSYEEVYTDTTGFAETVRVTYNPEVVSLEFLLQMYFKAIDPTSLNKQGHDEGTRYRTGIYYTHAEDLPIIEKVFAHVQKNFLQPLVVEKQPLENFYAAEAYHQDYLEKNPTGYCHLPLSLFEFARQSKAKK